jgi:membrane protease YdiL (CAAX protease family)
MSQWIAYLFLAIPLVMMFLFLNPVEVSWVVHHPHESMPPEDVIRAEKANRFLQPLRDITMVAILSGLMIHQGIKAAQVGLSLEHWPLNLGIGAAAGLLVIGLQLLLRAWMASVGHTAENRSLLQGSIISWALSLFIGALAEEYWIVLCIVAMTQSGHSVPASVVVTALVFGSSHFLLGIEVVPILAMSAVPSCLLFLWRGSILPLLLYHWVGNLGVLYWERRNNSGV